MRAIGKIVGLIVAAGYSSRMGTFKPLLPLGSKTVIETAVDSLRQGGVQDIRVIVGHRAAELYPVLNGLNIHIIENGRYAEGMFSSVVAGLENIAGEAEACFLLPGDTPLIRRRSIKALVREYRKTDAAVVYPVFNGQRGHPPLIGAKCFKNILQGSRDGCLRDILDGFAAESVELALADQGVLLDMDTAEDYKKLVHFYTRRDTPTPEECLAMLQQYQINGKVSLHGQVVADVGRRIAGLLNGAGLKLCIDLVVAGGLVHDLAKGKPNHSKRGERLITCMGFPALSGIIASHMDMEFGAECEVNEAAVVFLADKLVQGDRLVTLAERFGPALTKFSGNPEIINLVLRRMHTAEVIRDRIFGLLGVASLDEMALQ